MHHQIKAVIATMRSAPGNRVHIVFSAGQYTALGRVIGDMYYKTQLTDLLDSSQSSGYPHNGGQHTFRLTATPGDAIAFIEALKEELEGKHTVDEEHRQVISQLSFISQECYAFRK